MQTTDAQKFAVLKDVSTDARGGVMAMARVAADVHYMEREICSETIRFCTPPGTTDAQQKQLKSMIALMKEYGAVIDAVFFLVDSANKVISPPSAVLGFAAVCGLHTGACYLKFFYVRPEVDARGANLLLAVAEDDAKRCGCTVFESDVELDARMLGLFAARGYVVPPQLKITCHNGVALESLLFDKAMKSVLGARSPVRLENEIRDEALCKAASAAIHAPTIDTAKFKKDFPSLLVRTEAGAADLVWLGKQLQC